MRSPFSKEVYIRLTDDETALICTSKYGRLLSKATKFPLHRLPVREVHAEIATPRAARWPRSFLGLTENPNP
jgi:hypothetical protein